MYVLALSFLLLLNDKDLSKNSSMFFLSLIIMSIYLECNIV